MLAAGQLGDDSAIAGVGGDLGGDDRGEDASAALDDGSGGLVAGGFDAEDEAALAHPFSLAAGVGWDSRASVPLTREVASWQVSRGCGRTVMVSHPSTEKSRKDGSRSILQVRMEAAMLPTTKEFDAALRVVAELRAAGMRRTWREAACGICC